MKRILSLKKYTKVLRFLIIVCGLGIGAFIYPLSAYAAPSLSVDLNWLPTSIQGYVGVRDLITGKGGCISIPGSLGGGDGGDGRINPGDMVTIGVFPTIDDCMNNNTHHRSAVLFHRRVYKSLTCQVAPDFKTAFCRDALHVLNP